MCKTLRVITWCALVFAVLYFGGHVASWHLRVKQPTEQERAFHRAMERKHGNYTAFKESKEWYFYRNGKKCRWI